MNLHMPIPATLAEVIKLIERTEMSSHRHRDMISAIRRICTMMGCSPQFLKLDLPDLRMRLSKILPAAHDISAKTFANQKSLFDAALEQAGIIDRMPRGVARRDPRWGPLFEAISHDRRLADGLAAFGNWCTLNGVSPKAMTDASVTQFHEWLESRTLCLKLHDIVRRVPNLWNEAVSTIAGWPQIKLTPISFRAPSKHLMWDNLSEDLRREVERYLEGRANPDLFDERPYAPRRALARTTLRQHREHLRLAASILVRNGVPVNTITSLADLVDLEAFKVILRHYHDQAGGRTSAFAMGIAKSLIQVAQYHVGAHQSRLTV